MYKKLIKRMFDIVLASLTLILISPIFLIVSILIVIDSRGPIFFKQTRVGKDLVRFELIKFRTMFDELREVGDKPLLGKAEGVTNVGFILRRFKVDELPQLLNVIKGEMSIVGPRPSVPKQLDGMTQTQKHRYSVRPGLTGLAQVSGNILLDWKDRYKYDLQYIEQMSFWLDFRIVLKTFLIVVLGEDKFLKKPDDN